MEIAHQLSVFLANKPGTLAEVCNEMAAAGINIYALTISDTVDHAVVRMVVSDTQKALMVFGDHGTLAIENDVLLIDCDNRPGTFSQIAERLAKSRINIEYAYMSGAARAKRGLLVLRVNDTKKALKVLTA